MNCYKCSEHIEYEEEEIRAIDENIYCVDCFISKVPDGFNKRSNS